MKFWKTMIWSTVLITATAIWWPRAAIGSDPTRGTNGGDEDITAAAREIDRLVEVGLRRLDRQPNHAVDDETFLRRAYLGIIGRIPNPDEASRFLGSNDPSRRARLVDDLIASPGFESHLYNWFAELFRVRSRLTRQISGEPYIHWIKDAIATNKPYDQMARELVTASGAAYARNNGATGFLLRDQGMPLDSMSNTARVFLGTRFECAQCHDHPFEKWTQRDFFHLAAFTGGLQYRDLDTFKPQDFRKYQQYGRELRQKGDNRAYQSFRRSVLLTLTPGITGTGTGVVRLPDDYKYEDAKPLSFVTAATPFGPKVELDVRVPREARGRRAGRRPQNRRGGGDRFIPQVDSRSALADWMTSGQNPLFTRVIANRLWKRVAGIGLIEPVDDIRDDSIAANPELLRYLEGLMVEVDYDLRQFLRVLHRTRFFERESVIDAPLPGVLPAFEGPLLRRMSAEEVWDSLVTLVDPTIDQTLQAPESDAARAIYDHYERTLELTRSAKGPEDLIAQIEGNGQNTMRGMVRRRLRAAGGMVRASDMPSPAPDGHILREFGQSDREEIESSHVESTVPQALRLMNGFVDGVLTNAGRSALAKSINAARGPVEKIRNAYVAVLSRPPSKQEIEMWRSDWRRGPGAAWKDLLWTLVNSHEFTFVR